MANKYDIYKESIASGSWDTANKFKYSTLSNDGKIVAFWDIDHDDNTKKPRLNVGNVDNTSTNYKYKEQVTAGTYGGISISKIAENSYMIFTTSNTQIVYAHYDSDNDNLGNLNTLSTGISYDSAVGAHDGVASADIIGDEITLVVGDYEQNVNAITDSGQAYIFTVTVTGQTVIVKNTVNLVNGNGQINTTTVPQDAQFGRSVRISNDAQYIAVGGHNGTKARDGTTGTEDEAVVVLEWDGSNYSGSNYKFISSNIFGFGSAVDINASGDLIVGSYEKTDDLEGEAYLFNYGDLNPTNNIGAAIHTISGDSGEKLGRGVAISNREDDEFIYAVGSYKYDDKGRVQIFKYTTDNPEVPMDKIEQTIGNTKETKKGHIEGSNTDSNVGSELDLSMDGKAITTTTYKNPHPLIFNVEEKTLLTVSISSDDVQNNKSTPDKTIKVKVSVTYSDGTETTTDDNSDIKTAIESTMQHNNATTSAVTVTYKSDESTTSGTSKEYVYEIKVTDPGKYSFTIANTTVQDVFETDASDDAVFTWRVGGKGRKTSDLIPLGVLGSILYNIVNQPDDKK